MSAVTSISSLRTHIQRRETEYTRLTSPQQTKSRFIQLSNDRPLYRQLHLNLTLGRRTISPQHCWIEVQNVPTGIFPFLSLYLVTSNAIFRPTIANLCHTLSISYELRDLAYFIKNCSISFIPYGKNSLQLAFSLLSLVDCPLLHLPMLFLLIILPPAWSSAYP
jgi:hypothetical protein